MYVWLPLNLMKKYSLEYDSLVHADLPHPHQYIRHYKLIISWKKKKKKKKTLLGRKGLISTPSYNWPFFVNLGAKVFGHCAHIASVLWYLGFERYQPATKTSKMHDKYSRASMAWTTHTWVPRKKIHSCRFEIIYVDFPFYIGNGVLRVLIRIASILMRKHKIPSC